MIAKAVATLGLGLLASLLGYVFDTTINMDSTTIMQGVATVFIANVYNVELGMSGYLTVRLMSVLASIGSEGKFDVSVYNDPDAGILDSDDIQIDEATEHELADAIQQTHDRIQ